ncbi:hypothetical protein WJ96_06295 [Burkholderia ubonensis]|uniref:Uncharacterized protein n=1 Tax=Burkholderia ubonensis TaxID=101571 RepID=A0AAW3MRG4_9BURK|nr:hypothetical protein [Burkholderia ubonensis]KVP75368.1 hypothetical protein WJ93_08100 [Burkholderia ubonensis]KVP96833.1 hypothetical protein WJ97_13215 [Burkholderia ubonensis]KVP98179.1 hypothetical protein WJ96_06295 [Burkholderia ubonensis]KVZ92877.1 hypothetical protein WL25_17960 [Burkholderia ubonensis]
MWVTPVEIEFYITQTALPSDVPGVLDIAKNGFLLHMKDERPLLAEWDRVYCQFVHAGARLNTSDVHAWAALTYPLDKTARPPEHPVHTLVPGGPARNWPG